MGLRRPPYAFTRNGIGMLSSVLRSETAVGVNILIMRAFTADELLIEVRGSRVWVHFAVRPKNNRRKILFDVK